MIFQDIPNDIVVNPKIAVNQVITHSGNRTPLNLRILVSNLLRNVFSSLTYDFNASDKCTFTGFIAKKFGLLIPALSVSR
jgi:hypothetical protein